MDQVLTCKHLCLHVSTFDMSQTFSFYFLLVEWEHWSQKSLWYAGIYLSFCKTIFPNYEMARVSCTSKFHNFWKKKEKSQHFNSLDNILKSWNSSLFWTFLIKLIRYFWFLTRNSPWWCYEKRNQLIWGKN